VAPTLGENPQSITQLQCSRKSSGVHQLNHIKNQPSTAWFRLSPTRLIRLSFPSHSPLPPIPILGYTMFMKEPRQLQCSSPANAAFSLIELLVVLAILLILTTMYWNHGPSKRDIGIGACRQNLEKIYLAMQIYAHDNADKYPVSTNAVTSEDALALLVPHYTSDTANFICPVVGHGSLPADKSFRDWKISYAYYMGRRASDADKVLMTDAQINTESKGMGSIVFSANGKPPGNNHGNGGGNFLMGEGSVASSTSNAPFALPVTPPVVLLNPKP
jgi:prepilin-type N-terminal cleavage/methylation domain-containing protein